MYLFMAGIGLFLTIGATGYLIYSVVKKNGKAKKTGIALAIGVALFFIGAAMDDTPSVEKTASVNDDSKTDEKEENEKVKADEEEENEKVKADEEIDGQEVEEDNYADMKENIIGKSDKNFKDLSSANPKDVRNDSTGKWRLLTIAEAIDMKDYTMSYYEENMSDNEIHYVVNFTNNTTSQISKADGLLFLTITEYEKREEHNADELGNGMILKEYIIYPDGDIEAI